VTLISEEYRLMQKKLHNNESYGSTGVTYADLINKLIARHKFNNILDYGSGKCGLKTKLKNINYIAYEPSNERYAETPEPCEFVVCIDVLEHIEPDCLDNVLDDLKRVTSNLGFFTINTQPAKKKLPDGRNAHLIQQKIDWWLPKIESRFEVIVRNQLVNRCEFVVKAK